MLIRKSCYYCAKFFDVLVKKEHEKLLCTCDYCQNTNKFFVVAISKRGATVKNESSLFDLKKA